MFYESTIRLQKNMSDEKVQTHISNGDMLVFEELGR